MDEVFEIATGWLGWTASEAWSTPVIEILMAWEAKSHFLKATNPFGKGAEKPSKEAVAKEARMGFRAAALGRNPTS